MSSTKRLSVKRNTINKDQNDIEKSIDDKEKDIYDKVNEELEINTLKSNKSKEIIDDNNINEVEEDINTDAIDKIYKNVFDKNKRTYYIRSKNKENRPKITVNKGRYDLEAKLNVKQKNKPGIYPNMDSYPTFMKDKIDHELNNVKVTKLREHQHIVKQFMAGRLTNYNPRGVLLYHLMGTGKTMAMISCAIVIGRPILCVMSKSLVNNFILGIKLYEKKFKTKIGYMFSFVSLDAYNMIDQIKKEVGYSLDGITVVVDEAHELFTQIVNSENKNGPKLYEMIMRANDIHLIFGSGTPIIKDPFELVPCVNMLTGKNTLPTSYDDFMSLFVKDPNLMSDVALDEVESEFQTEESKIKNNNNLLIKNADKLQNRLFGIISYATNNPALFPKKLPTIVERIPMSDKQLTAYRVARESEIKETEKNFKKSSNGPGVIGQKMGKAKNKSSSTYRQKSRSLCNGYYDPEYKKDISTKVDKLMENINREKGKGIVYSQFKDAGVYRIAERMINEGWSNFRGNNIVRSHHSEENEVIYKNNKTINNKLTDDKISDDESDSLKGDIYEREPPMGGNKDNLDVIENDKEIGDIEELIEEEKVERESGIKDDIDDVIDKIIEERKSVNNTQEIDEIEDDLIDDNIINRDSEDKNYNTRIISADGKSIKYRDKVYIRGKKSKTFAILDGDVPLNVRKQILEIYNSPENLDGQILCMLLVTTVGSRGITLIACKHSHYFEPYWYLFRMLQFETRANRDSSHLMLPDDEQTTQLFVYLSTFPTEVIEKTKQIIKEKKSVITEAKYKSMTEIETTDETLYFRSINRQYILDNFLDIMKEVSIECPHINRLAHLNDEQKIKINCKMCAPLGNKIYTDNIFEDSVSDSPCKLLEESNEETKSFEYKGITYEYSNDNNDAQDSIYKLAIYKYNETLKAYTRIEEYEDIFNELFLHIKHK